MASFRQRQKAAFERASTLVRGLIKPAGNDAEKITMLLWHQVSDDPELLYELARLGCGSIVRDQLAATSILKPPGNRGPVSPIDRDQELSSFIDERLGDMPVAQIAAECVQQFGAMRAPSKSAIHRYWHRRSKPEGRR